MTNKEERVDWARMVGDSASPQSVIKAHRREQVKKRTEVERIRELRRWVMANSLVLTPFLLSFVGCGSSVWWNRLSDTLVCLAFFLLLATLAYFGLMSIAKSCGRSREESRRFRLTLVFAFSFQLVWAGSILMLRCIALL